jgi:transposase
MDNVAFHKTIAVRSQIEQAGHQVLYLPPYSPFLNPIEQLFSKWKNIVWAQRPQNETHLFELIENGCQQITQEDCAGFYRHMIGMIIRCLNREAIIDE